MSRQLLRCGYSALSAAVTIRGMRSTVAEPGHSRMREWLTCITLALATCVAVATASSEQFVVAAMCVMPKRGDKEANLASIEQWAQIAASRGARVVITPEAFIDGYVAKHTKLKPSVSNAAEKNRSNALADLPLMSREAYADAAETINGSVMSRLRTLARSLEIYLAVGFTERRGQALFNSVVVLSPRGETVLHYAKTHNATGHEIYNALGDVLPVVDTPHGRWGALICFDRQLPEAARVLALKQASFVLIPSFGGYGEINDALIRTRAYENGVWVAFVHPRRCLIVAPDGNVVAQNDGAGDQIVYARIVLDERVGRAAIRERRPDLYGEILELRVPGGAATTGPQR